MYNMKNDEKSVIGGEFHLNDTDSENVFTMEDFDSDQRMMAESCIDFLERAIEIENKGLNKSIWLSLVNLLDSY